MTMRHADGLYFGTVDLSIGDIVEEIPAFFKDLAMVVTRVDSRGIVTFKPEWEALHRMERRGHAAVFPPYGVVKLFENNWPFDGFEEIFLCDYSDIPELVYAVEEQFTPNCMVLADEIPNEFLSRFNSLRAKRFLSDGLGLMNYVCEKEFAEEIERFFDAG